MWTWRPSTSSRGIAQASTALKRAWRQSVSRVRPGHCRVRSFLSLRDALRHTGMRAGGHENIEAHARGALEEAGTGRPGRHDPLAYGRLEDMLLSYVEEEAATLIAVKKIFTVTVKAARHRHRARPPGRCTTRRASVLVAKRAPEGPGSFPRSIVALSMVHRSLYARPRWPHPPRRAGRRPRLGILCATGSPGPTQRGSSPATAGSRSSSPTA